MRILLVTLIVFGGYNGTIFSLYGLWILYNPTGLQDPGLWLRLVLSAVYLGTLYFLLKNMWDELGIIGVLLWSATILFLMGLLSSWGVVSLTSPTVYQTILVVWMLLSLYAPQLRQFITGKRTIVQANDADEDVGN